MITEIQHRQIFVFGSNLAGIHGAGAAKQALRWGAKRGVGEGMSGQTYALPTKDQHIRTRSLEDIQKSVTVFLNFARSRPDLEFLVTAVGCGLAGYKPSQISPMFRKSTLPKNVLLPREFL